MRNLAWMGFAAAAAMGVWIGREVGDGGLLVNLHGLILVLGGVVGATLINYPPANIRRAFGSLLSLFGGSSMPSPAVISAEIMRLAEVAKAQGGLLALQDEGRGLAGGFLDRALFVALATGEAQRTREILEAEIRQKKLLLLEDANLFRTVGTLAPMFGLLGTLVGIILVLRNMADPLKVGPAMAVAITASLYGIGLANLFCIPVAGNLRTRAIEEARARELIMEGVLDLLRQEPAYLLSLRLGAYAPEPPEAAGEAAGAET